MNRSEIIQLSLAGLAGVTVVALAFVGFSGWESLSPAAVTHEKPSDRPLVEDFVLPDLEGKPVRFSTYVSGRPFAITFGQTTCPPCIQQSVIFKELEAEYGEKVAFLKVYIGQSPETAARQVEELGSSTKTLIDLEARIYYRYGEGPIPVTLVGDGQGRIITIGSFIPEQALRQRLDEALHEQSVGRTEEA